MKLIVGNWKMNQTVAEVRAFFHDLTHGNRRHEAWVAPQTLHIPLALSLTPASVKIGAQNCSQHLKGAFTGETSPAALQELGAAFVLVGHSERRQLFAESNASCRAKLRGLLALGLTAIYCVGETIAERDAGQTLAVIQQQVEEGLKEIGSFDSHQLIVAYEPVWAIGTGKVATAAQAQEVHAFLRQKLTALFPATGADLRLLYGGSVKPENIQELMGMPDIDGALVGGASLKAQDFLALCQ